MSVGFNNGNLNVGTDSTSNQINQVRSSAGQWIDFDDQTDTFGFYNSAGSPEGVVAANTGSICSDTTNGDIYKKTTDTANTGWIGIPTIIQQVNTSTSSYASTTTVIPSDDTIPQQTEGSELLTLAITPTNASNTLLIEFTGWGHCASDTVFSVALFQDSTADAIAAVGANNLGNSVKAMSLRHFMTAGTTSSTTFKIRYGPSSAVTVSVNGAGGRYYGGVSSTVLSITEIRA